MKNTIGLESLHNLGLQPFIQTQRAEVNKRFGFVPCIPHKRSWQGFDVHKTRQVVASFRWKLRPTCAVPPDVAGDGKLRKGSLGTPDNSAWKPVFEQFPEKPLVEAKGHSRRCQEKLEDALVKQRGADFHQSAGESHIAVFMVISQVNPI